MPGGKEEVDLVNLYNLIIIFNTGLSNDYEIMARKNSIYYPLLFCLLNFGIGMQ